MKLIVWILVLLSWNVCADDTPLSITQFLKKYDQTVKTNFTILKKTKCIQEKSAETKGKTVAKCALSLPNSHLSIDAFSNNVMTATLLIDPQGLPHADDIYHAPGLLVGIARGDKDAGDFLQFGEKALQKMLVEHRKSECTYDLLSRSALCSTFNGGIYSFMLYRYQRVPSE
ncbi:hypothetical protein [Methylomonas sp. AM2-LC]|uniref:hypothetical protein n=1 Tax=Methylomonas sp. AM2-LC TaxID=3153301 RepID=UPI0032645749